MTSKNNYILKNQRLLKETQVKISINDRNFLFGDGIFETCKIYNYQIYNFDNHLKRLKFGLKSLQINYDLNNIKKNCLKLIKKNQIKNGLLKINISRGTKSIGYKPHNSKAYLIATTHKKRKITTNITLGFSSYKTPNIYLGKTSNSLTYILSKIEATNNGFFDNILLDNNNHISETSSANIFWVKNNQIYTPPTNTNLIPGTIRQKILDLKNFNITQKLATKEELLQSDEIFLTNCSFVILAVNKILNKNLEINLSLKLQKIINQDIAKSCPN